MAYNRLPQTVLAGVALVQNPPPGVIQPAGIVPVTLDCAIATTSSVGVVQVGSGLAVTAGGVLSTTNTGAYSFGSWTPSLVPSAGSIQLSVEQAKYVKIGQLVNCTFDIIVTGFTGGQTTNPVQLAGLPFVSLTDNSYVGSVTISFFENLDSTTTLLSGTVLSNSDDALLWQVSGSSTSMTSLRHIDLKVTSKIVGTITYLSAS